MKAVYRDIGAVIVAVIAVIAFSTPAWALDSQFSGSRALGMGGTGVATVNDTNAQYYNPAAFGFFSQRDVDGERLAIDSSNMAAKDWGLDMGMGLGYRLHEDLGDLIDDLSQIDVDALSQDGIVTEASLKNLTKVSEILSKLDNPGNGITLDTNGALALRIKHGAIGVRSFYQASGRVLNIDTTNLGISGAADTAALNTNIEGIALTGDDGATSLFTAAQIAQLSAAGLSAAAIQNLDYAARQAGIDAGALQETTDLLADLVATTGSATDTLENNTTRVALRAFGYYEIPLSYGWAINDNISIGGNIKAMFGQVYATQILVFQKDSGDILKEADNDYEETLTYGLDLGVMARVDKFQFGLTGRNLNAPEFDGPTVAGVKYNDVTLDPQVTAGVAFIPAEFLTFAIDYDLTENETALDDYDVQNLSVGVEWDIIRILTLRLGFYENQAESDIGLVYTAGLGLNAKLFRLDLSGAMSDETGEYDGSEIPIETRVNLQLSFDF